MLQGIDTSGKGGTVEHVFGAREPGRPAGHVVQGALRVRAGARLPLAGPRQRPPGRRDRRVRPEPLRGRHRGARARPRCPRSGGRSATTTSTAFEQLLADEGTTIVKVLLHISKDEQKRRLEARLDEPHKHWKFRLSDLDARKQWDDYQVAFAEAVERTATEHAPWHVIPADKKWYRNWAVATIVTGVLEGLDLTWPESPDDLTGVVIE